MVEHKLIRVEHPADPERCQSNGATGQCPFKAVPGTNNCSRHSGRSNSTENDTNIARTYKLKRFQERINQFSDDGKIKSLREEIAMSRCLLEEIWNSCESTPELLINSHKISGLVMNIEKLVTTCNNLETKMGMMLDRTAIVQMASVIVEIISQYIVDPEQREIASENILEVVTKTIVIKEK